VTSLLIAVPVHRAVVRDDRRTELTSRFAQEFLPATRAGEEPASERSKNIGERLSGRTSVLANVGTSRRPFQFQVLPDKTIDALGECRVDRREIWFIRLKRIVG
jgi:hypothetical protein